MHIYEIIGVSVSFESCIEKNYVAVFFVVRLLRIWFNRFLGDMS